MYRKFIVIVSVMWHRQEKKQKIKQNGDGFCRLLMFVQYHNIIGFTIKVRSNRRIWVDLDFQSPLQIP